MHHGIQQSTNDGRDYFSATVAGIAYTASCDCIGWNVHSYRLALGRHNPGSVKRFASLAELAATHRAFRGLDALVTA